MKAILRGQGRYYIASGLLPLVSMRTFERLTGKKTDTWLVRMVALLAVTVGASLWTAAENDEIGSSATLLSIASALAFAGIDVVYSAKRRISPIYLLDALVELGIVGLVVKEINELG